MERNIEWYVDLVNDLIESDGERNKLFEGLELMVRPSWNFPDDSLKDVMAIVDSTPSDAINAGAVAMSGVKPVFSIAPRAANVYEYDRTERIEDVVKWHFMKCNKRGSGTGLFDMSWSSLLYNTIAVQMFDLVHILPKNKKIWTPLQKRAWAGGRFIPRVHNPKGIHTEDSSLGISTIVSVQDYSVADVIAHWELYAGNVTDEGKRVAQGLRDLQTRLDEKKASSTYARDQRFVQYYAMDDDKIVVFGQLLGDTTPGESIEERPAKADIVFVDQKNRYGFMNWSFRVAGSRLEEKPEYRVNPILAPLYWSGAWDKLNFAKSLIFSEPIRRARSPRSMSKTSDGQPPEVDMQDGNAIALKSNMNEDYEVFQPYTLDPNGMAILAAMEAAMNRTTGASVLGDTTKISSDTPYATFAAMVKVAMSRLDRQREIIGDSCADIACQMLYWSSFTKEPLVAYQEGVKETRGTRKRVPMGQMIAVTESDYDELNLDIQCRINPRTPTDEQEQIAAAIQLSQQLNVPVSKVLEEKLGYENISLLYEQWTNEFLRNATVQAKAAEIAQRSELAVQIEGQQQMAQGQAQPPVEGAAPGMEGQGQGLSNIAFGALGAAGGGGERGLNPAIGEMSPTQAAPGVNREQILGRTYADEQF